jgi:hypothetical protein
VNLPLSGLEMVVLAVLTALVLGVGWAYYSRASGRTASDVKGLHLGRGHQDPPV